MPDPFRRLQGLFWDHSLAIRRPARRLKRALSVLAYRARAWRGAGEPARVVTELARKTDPGAEPIPHPAIAVLSPDGGREAAERFLARQTETSAALEAPDATFAFVAGGDLDDLPPTLLESLLLAAAAESLELCAGGWTAPARGRFGPSGELCATGDRTVGPPPTLLRVPRRGGEPPVLGRTVGHVTGRQPETAAPLDFPPLVKTGPHLLRPDLGPGRVVRQRVRPVDAVLAALPEIPGPRTGDSRTVLFLLPFLAVGGAEHLLLDLLAGLRRRYLLLVVTLEPHLAHLGQTVDACRDLTPHVYTLGDWLPREAHAGALYHLLRRYAVETLVCWNGSVDFYDLAPALRRDFPRLRILNQLYNHEGGWIERYGPALAAAVDLHLAVNRRIAAALVEQRGVAAERIAVVHHGVRVPPEPSPAERAERRRKSRDRLGLPPDAVVAGTFVRLHPQKRPLDVLLLARRTTHLPVHYLLAGGGPAAEALDHELEREPIPNLTRLPMQDDVESLYDAIDVCLSTSSYEGLPVFLLDGLARSLPCVATAVGEIPELLRDGGGVLVERPGDLDALAAGLETLLDAERRAAEGRRGRATVVERFGLETYRARYESLIFPEGKAVLSHPRSSSTERRSSSAGGNALPEASSTVTARVEHRAQMHPDGTPRDRSARPQASVVIPSYNHGRFVEAAVDSVLDQDADLELVVVDDGSTDDSRERLAGFADDPRVRIFEQPNHGAHAALNRGLGLARGEIFFILNSDDLFEPGRVRRFLERFAADPGIAVLASWLRVIDEGGRELGTKEAWRNLPPWPRPGSGPGLADLGDPVLALLETNWVATTSNLAFRRRLFAEGGLRFAELRYTHDWDFLLAAAAHGEIAILEDPLARYRVHKRSTIGEGRDEGMGSMRFEILWTVARHARKICRRFEARGMDPADLRRRLGSLPRFGCGNVLAQLLFLRGEGEEPPPAYDALLDPGHPYRRRAVELLETEL